MTSPATNSDSSPGFNSQLNGFPRSDTPEGIPSHSHREGKHAIPSNASVLMQRIVNNGESPTPSLINGLKGRGAPPSGVNPASQGSALSQSSQIEGRVGRVKKDSYQKAIGQLVVVSLFMIGAFYLFLEPLTFNVLGLFAILGVYFSSQLYTEYANNYWHNLEVHHSALSVFYGAITVAHTIIALRYLTLLSAFPVYTLSLCFVSAVCIWINASRCRKFADIERKINKRNLV